MANDRMRAWLTRPGGLATQLVAARGALSMRNLADLLGDGWSSSRISKLEHGQQLPTAEDLSQIAAGLQVGAEQLATWRELLEEASGKRANFAKRRQTTASGRDNLAHLLEVEASFIRATGPFLIPELLQTRNYAHRALITLEVPGIDAAQTAKQISDRQEILSDLERAFQFLIPESALRTVIGGAGIMTGQLDRLISASSMSNVQIAVLPQMQPNDALPLSGAVTIYDSDAVVDDGVEMRHYGPAQAAQIIERMDDLWNAALRGDAARKLILKVAEEFSA